MSSTISNSKTSWIPRRFWRLFRREKASFADVHESYQYLTRFPRLPITIPPLVPTLMSYRWNDEDDHDISPKKPSRNHQQQPIRRRFSKRYSDIVGPSSTKIYLPRRASTRREKKTTAPSSSRKHPRASFKRNNAEGSYIINSHNKKSTEILPSFSKSKKHDQSSVKRRYSSKSKRLSNTNAVDHLAHRMQAAMSAELMHSLDRNFVFGEKKAPVNGTNVNRSHSFHTSIPQPIDCWEKSNYPHLIPRVNESLDEKRKSLSLKEPTPDYEDEEDQETEIIIRTIEYSEIGEEPIVDYDELHSSPTYELEETTSTPYDLGVSSSFIAPFTSITPSSDIDTQDLSSIPPTPPPLPKATIEQTTTTVRCRTIAEKITPNHKLILKDQSETKSNTTEEKLSYSQYSLPHLPDDYSKNSRPTPQPYRLHLSKELLEKTTLRKVSHPVSRSYSTYGSMSQLNDHTIESNTFCRKTSTIDEQPLDGLSSSATTSIVIDNEHEHRTSSKIYNDYKQRTSLITVPTSNTLNSTHSQSTIIHPMHTHIGLRSSTSSSSPNDKPSELTLTNRQMNLCVINQLNQHLTTRFRKQQQQQQEVCVKKNINSIKKEKINVYDEPQHVEISKTISTQFTDLSISSLPPPPPPLPVGGFRPVQSHRTSLMALPREMNTTDRGCSTGTSTTSSKLSDTRILRELRTNPLFAKAKQHLEIPEPERSNCSFNLDRRSMESFIMHPDELQQPKISPSNSKSELELLFQKRAQRSQT